MRRAHIILIAGLSITPWWQQTGAVNTHHVDHKFGADVGLETAHTPMETRAPWC